MITRTQRINLIDAIDFKIASIKRAMNTNRNPRFAELYKAELEDFMALRVAVADLPEPDELLKPKK